jgi:hypothetical protein
MRWLTSTPVVTGAAALVGIAGVANASATIDLIWADTGTNQISSVSVSDNIQLNVILTAGPNGSLGADVGVDYSGVLGRLVVIDFMNTPSSALPLTFAAPIDTGDRIERFNSAALPPASGIGLAAGASAQLGTVTFHQVALIHGVLTIQSDANGPTAGVLDFGGNLITATTTFNSAYLVGSGDPPQCSAGPSVMQIEVNALRAGGKTIVTGPNDTTKVTAKARILKGTAPSGTTLVTDLSIEARDGGDVIGSGSQPNITLKVGKGGKGASIDISTEQCNSGFIDFRATFTGVDAENDPCIGTREIHKACR